MLIQLANGTAIAADGTIVPVAANTEALNHTAQALSRLIEFWRGKPNMAGWLSDYMAEIQVFETACWGVISSRLLPLATGAQMDQLGAIVGEARGSLGDTDYRARINARIRINRSFGTPEDIIAIVKLIETASFVVLEYQPATLVVEFTAPTTIAAGVLASLLNQARAAGVALQVLDQAQVNSFLLGDSTVGGTPDAAHGLSGASETTGGYLAGDY